MNTVKIGNVEFGKGLCKICVPIVAETFEDAVDQSMEILNTKADIVELRVDWLNFLNDEEKIKSLLKKLKSVLGDIPVLYTFRTYGEGGRTKLPKEKYLELIRLAIKSELVDAIDVELFTGDEEVKEIVSLARNHNIKTIGSNHDFDKTPSKDEIINRLKKMQELGLDIPKIAVMPNSKKDVKELLDATYMMSTEYADRPIITMSMGSLGVISRISGDLFGSSMTFGSVKEASAPGQVDAEKLYKILNTVDPNK